MNRFYCVLIVIAFCGGVGCGRVEKAWDAARSVDTIAAYEEFASKYPRGTHAAEAATRIDELRASEAAGGLVTMRFMEILHYVPDDLTAARPLRQLDRLRHSGAWNLSRALVVYGYRGLAVRRWGDRDELSGAVELRALSPSEVTRLAGSDQHARGEWKAANGSTMTFTDTLRFLQMPSYMWGSESDFRKNRTVLSVNCEHIPHRERDPGVWLNRMSKATLQQYGADIGFDFGDAWSTPFAVQGDSLPAMEFQHGGMRLSSGQVAFLEGTLVRLDMEGGKVIEYTKAGWRPQRSAN